MLSEPNLEPRLVHIYYDVAYLPKPNTVKAYITSVEAPQELTRTAFMVPLVDHTTVVLATNRRRGEELPGGHRDSYTRQVPPDYRLERVTETMREAAIRETWEEVGCRVDKVIPLGYLMMETQGDMPDNWHYPYPLGYQQFYAGLVTSYEQYVPNDECLRPHFIQDVTGVKMPARLFIEHARQQFYGDERTLIKRAEIHGWTYEAWRLTEPNEYGSFFEIRFGKDRFDWVNNCRRCQTNEDVLIVLQRLLDSIVRNSSADAQTPA